MPLILLCLLLVLPLHAAEYHVSPSGKDSSKGSRQTPWKTIQRGVSGLSAGDTLIVHDGTYREHVKLGRSGERNRPIHIRANNPQRAQLEGGSFRAFNVSDIKLEGFLIKNTSDDQPSIDLTGTGSHVEIVNNEITGLQSKNSAALRVRGAMSNVIIRNNHVHHNNTGNQEAIRVSERTHDFQILDNRVTDNTNIGIDVVGWAQFGKPYNGLIRGNVTLDNATGAPWASGIYLDGPDNIIVEYNVSSGNWIGIQFGCEPSNDSSKNNIARYNLVHGNREYGFSIGGYTGGTVHHCQIHNNVFANNKRAMGFSRNAGHDNLVVNNILFEPNGQAINFLSKPKDTQIDFNCYTARFGEMPGTRSLRVDPMFVDLEKRDFRLRRGSPCIDAGRMVLEGLKDRNGIPVPRNQKPDIGAFEF